MKKNGLLTCIILFSSLGFFAQNIIPGDYQFLTNPDNPDQGNFIWANGFSKTKKEILIPFQLDRNKDSVIVGYKYAYPFLEAVTENDIVLLYIPKLSITSSLQGLSQSSHDICGKKVIAVYGLEGAWKELTIVEKHKKTAEKLVFIVKEKCMSIDYELLDTLSFVAMNGHYLLSGTSLSNRTKPDLSIESLILELKNQDKKVRKDAAIALWVKKDNRAVEPLIEALKFKDSYPIVIAALNALKYNWMNTEPAKNLVPTFIASLKSQDINVRIQAAEILGIIKDTRAVEPLILTLKQKDCYTAMLKALNAIKPDWTDTEPAKNLVPTFIASLKSPDYNVRIHAAEMLGIIKDNRAVEPLILALNQKDSYPALLKALETIKPDWTDTEPAKNLVPTFIASLEDKDKNVRQEAVVMLGRIKDHRAVEPLIIALEEEDDIVRATTALALGTINDKRAVAPLIFALKYPNSYWAVKKALEKIEPDWMNTKAAKNAVPAYIAFLQDGNFNARYEAAQVLAIINDKRAIEPLIYALKYKEGYNSIKTELEKIEPGWMMTEVAKTTVPFYIKLLNNEDANIREQAAKVLGELKEIEAVAPLIVALKDENKEVRLEATAALGSMKDLRAVEPLITNLKDADKDIRYETVKALGSIKDNRALEPLFAALKDENRDVRAKTTWALMELKDTRAVEPLIYAMKDRDIYHYAISALDTIQPDWITSTAARNVVPVFIDLLNDEDYFIRVIAAYALEHLKDKRAVEPLITALKDNDKRVRGGVCFALGSIKDPRAVKPLIALLNDEDRGIRRDAARALGEIKDKRAVNPLKVALKDNDKYVRQNAAKALEQITGNSFPVE